MGVISDLQTGTTFTVTLPVYLSAPPGAFAAEAAEAAEAIAPSAEPSRELEAPETDGDEIEEGTFTGPDYQTVDKVRSSLQD